MVMLDKAIGLDRMFHPLTQSFGTGNKKNVYNLVKSSNRPRSFLPIFGKGA